MPQVFELLGYPLSDNSRKVIESRKEALCPFMNAKCDGGGNRFMSELLLKDHPELRKFFKSMERVPAGICSIQLSDNLPPWIICPRRLLYMGRKADNNTLAGITQHRLFSLCNFPPDSTIGVWAETKVKYSDRSENGDEVLFDYTFDYVLCVLGRVSLNAAVSATGCNESELKAILTKSGHTFALINGETVIEDFPIGIPYIVEIMTSSTSGGNKRNRSCIPQAFEDCVLGKEHSAPGINYRQVWARMASQLIVKSQAAIAWGGFAIWVLQDVLADYISSSTALDFKKFVAKNLSEVNVLSFSYSDKFKSPTRGETVNLSDYSLFAGPIRPYNDKKEIRPSFQDIVLASICPPKSVLLSALCKKPLSNIFKI